MLIAWAAFLQFICCVLLYTFANVLATLFSKTLASHFHKATHFALMQEAFLKASYSGLESLLYPWTVLNDKALEARFASALCFPCRSITSEFCRNEDRTPQ